MALVNRDARVLLGLIAAALTAGTPCRAQLHQASEAPAGGAVEPKTVPAQGPRPEIVPTLDLRGPFPNQICSTAISLGGGIGATGSLGLATGSTAGAADYPGPNTPACGLSGPAASGHDALWYRVYGTGTPITVSTCGPFTNFDTVLRVYCNFCTTAGDVCIAANDDSCGRASQVTFCSRRGVQYDILISGYFPPFGGVPSEGNFQIQATADTLPCAGSDGGCIPIGACCSFGRCLQVSQADCTSSFLQGVYQGDGTTCATTSQSVSGQFIPDFNNGVPGKTSDTLELSAGVPIEKVNIGVDISHTFQGDVRVTLRHNEGTEATLIDRPGYPQLAFGFAADNFGRRNAAGGEPFIIDSGMYNDVFRVYDPPDAPASGLDNVSGRWRSSFGVADEQAQGRWTLSVYDHAAADTGFFTRWWFDIAAVHPRGPVSVAIPDAQCPSTVQTTRYIPLEAIVAEVEVTTSIVHTWIGDLRVSLLHQETGTEVVLWNQVCGSNDNLETQFTDTGSVLACTMPLPLTLSPATCGGSALSAFRGQNARGTWALRVCDGAGQDVGTIQYFGLRIRFAGNPVCLGAPDVFTRGAALVGGRLVAGGPNFLADTLDCVGDWDRSGTVEPSDVALYINSWFYALSNPGSVSESDLDGNGQVDPTDIATFVNYWLGGLAPGGMGCP